MFSETFSTAAAPPICQQSQPGDYYKRLITAIFQTQRFQSTIKRLLL
jgi:hypothetical protein